MALKVANNAVSTLAAAITSSAPSLSVQAGDATLFPTLSAGDWFPLTLIDNLGNREIVRATARAGAAITITRSQEGTTAKAFPLGSKVELRLTAAAIDDKASVASVTAKADAAATTTALAGKSNTGHTHSIAEVTGLQAALDAKQNASGAVAIPAGIIAAFAGGSAPTGWLKANGAAVSRTTYSTLYAAIGTLHGAGDGSTTFNLPDLRGEFIRGLDDGRNLDTGRVQGSIQTSQNLSHTHALTDPGHGHTGTTSSAGSHSHSMDQQFGNTGSGTLTVGAGLSTGPQNMTMQAAGAHTHTVSITTATTGITMATSGGSEARPRSVAELYIIKY